MIQPNRGSGEWQDDYFGFQRAWLNRGDSTYSQSNWHTRYDHSQAQHDSQGGAAQGSSGVAEDEGKAGDEEEESDDSKIGDEDSGNETDVYSTSHKIPDNLRDFLQIGPLSSIGRSLALPHLPERPDHGSDGDEEEDEEGGEIEDESGSENEKGRQDDRGPPRKKRLWRADRPRGPGTGVHRGPRKAAPLTPDIAFRMAQANEEYLNQNIKQAAMHAMDVIRVNAEIHQAWTLLATIFQDIEETSAAAKSLVFAAHLKPKEVDAWFNAADYCLTKTGLQMKEFFPTALFCFRGAARAKPKSVEARVGQADVYMRLGKPHRAVTYFLRALKLKPHDRQILTDLAKACLDSGQPQDAIDKYKESFAYWQAAPDEKGFTFEWDELDKYISLYESIQEWATAIKELKSVARWLVGRETETFWDDVTQNDCEWDLDDSRRCKIPSFNVGSYPSDAYYLPVELRVRLGICRLNLENFEEAMVHLSCLDPTNERGESQLMLKEYSHYFREVADAMVKVGRYGDALKFFQPLKQESEDVDISMLFQMGKCFLENGDDDEALAYFQEVADLDATDVDSRVELARLYEKQAERGKAFDLVNEVMRIRKGQGLVPKPKPRKISKKKVQKEILGAESFLKPDVAPKPGRPGREPRIRQPTHYAIEEAKRLKSQYDITVDQCDGMRRGDHTSTYAWARAANELINDFRAFRAFYPWEKYQKFVGYSIGTRVEAETALDKDLNEMAERLAKELNAEIEGGKIPAMKVPEHYRGLSFHTWLDMFMDFALCLARIGRVRESYDVCEAAKDCIIWVHSREDMFMIYVCLCMCALLANDEQVAMSTARWFAKEYQFTTDSYRLLSAVGRVCHSPMSWYSSGPTQKFILRQIRAMDYTLVDEDTRAKFFTEKGSYSALDEEGHLVVNKDLDINLLMLYGHILYAGNSYTLALNYFFRCHALDPENPVINLMIGLAYISDCLKRQAENRQYSVLQGTTFLLVYYESRKNSEHLEERQEAHYNMARAYHMLGLPHLAIPYYQKVLDEVAEGMPRSKREDLVIDTAYNLQTMYAVAGNMELARQVTKRWLVI